MTDHLPASPFGPDLWDVLARHVAGESPLPEADAVRKWLAEDSRRADLLANIERAIGTLSAPAADVDVDAAWRRVAGRIQQPDVKVLPIRREPPAFAWRTIGLRAAAVIALVVGAGTIAIWRGVGAGGSVDLTPVRVIATLPGQTDSVRLIDGTRVIVGPGSELTVAAGYGTTARSVTLKGEALFDVIHSEKQPFTVQAGGALIEDLGTTFTVRQDGDEGVRVVVTAGTVRLQGPDRQQGPGPVVLKPGDRGTVGRDGRVTAHPRSAKPDDLAWTRGQLVFEDATLSRVRSDLKRWYGVDCVVDNQALANRHITATFAGEPVQRVLDVIGLALGARIERHGDSAVVRAR